MNILQTYCIFYVIKLPLWTFLEILYFLRSKTRLSPLYCLDLDANKLSFPLYWKLIINYYLVHWNFVLSNSINYLQGVWQFSSMGTSYIQLYSVCFIIFIHTKRHYKHIIVNYIKLKVYLGWWWLVYNSLPWSQCLLQLYVASCVDNL